MKKTIIAENYTQIESKIYKSEVKIWGSEEEENNWIKLSVNPTWG